jgi:hypothetical protein
MANILLVGVPIMMTVHHRLTKQDGRHPPQLGIAAIQVSSYPVSLFTCVCSFIAMVISTRCPV